MSVAIEKETIDYSSISREEFLEKLRDCATVDMAHTVLKQLSIYDGEVSDEIQIRLSMAGHHFNMLQFNKIKRI